MPDPLNTHPDGAGDRGGVGVAGDVSAVFFAGLAVVLFFFWVLIKLRSPNLESEKMKRLMRRNFDLETQQGRDNVRKELNASTGQYSKATPEEKEELFDLLDKLDQARSGQVARQAEVQRRWKLLLKHKHRAEQAGGSFKTKGEMQDLMTLFGVRVQKPIAASDASQDAEPSWQEFLKEHTTGGVLLLPGQYGRRGEIVGKMCKEDLESDDDGIAEEGKEGGGGAVQGVSGRCDACGKTWSEPVVCEQCDATYYCSEGCRDGAKNGHRKKCKETQKKAKRA